MIALALALAAACAALALALRRARREAADLRGRAAESGELLHALSAELNRARAAARPAAPTPAPAPVAPHRCDRCAAVELADAIFAQPRPPLYVVEAAHRRGAPRLVFAVRWGEA